MPHFCGLLTVRHHVFYVYLALGFVVFGAGLFLVPGWFKILWAAGCLAFAATLPLILEKLLDPLNIRRITRHLSINGATDIEVKPFSNHYGARYIRDGAQHYAKCNVKRGKVAVAEREPKASRT
jgi:hypothetical protein